MTTEVMQPGIEPRAVRRKATIEEFWALPASVLPTEYINGEIILAPSPTLIHQTVIRNIFRTLDKFVRQAAIGETLFSPLDIILQTGEVVQPDIFFLTYEEAKHARAEGRVYGAPSFAVEILSPGSVKHDAITKRNLYEQNGVLEYWIVDPDATTIAQLILREGHYTLTELAEGDTIQSVVLTGFEMNVKKVMSDE